MRVGARSEGNMGVDVLTEIDIGCPVNNVASFAGNPANAPVWYENIRSIEWIGEPAVKVGAKIAFVAHFLGKRLSYTYEIVDFVPGERLVMRTSEGPFPMETTYAWSEAPGGGTHMTLRNRGEPSGFPALLAPFMVPAMKSANRKDLQKLKRVMEAEESAPAQEKNDQKRQ